PVPVTGPGLEPDRVADVVRMMRAGDVAADRRRHAVTTASGVSTLDTLHLLKQAVRDRRAVWLGYVNASRAASERIVRPASRRGARAERRAGVGVRRAAHRLRPPAGGDANLRGAPDHRGSADGRGRAERLTVRRQPILEPDAKAGCPTSIGKPGPTSGTPEGA